MNFWLVLALFTLFTLCVSFPLACLIGRIIHEGKKGYEPIEGREQVGIDSPNIWDYVAECRERDARARARHAGRKTA